MRTPGSEDVVTPRLTGRMTVPVTVLLLGPDGIVEGVDALACPDRVAGPRLVRSAAARGISTGSGAAPREGRDAAASVGTLDEDEGDGAAIRVAAPAGVPFDETGVPVARASACGSPESHRPGARSDGDSARAIRAGALTWPTVDRPGEVAGAITLPPRRDRSRWTRCGPTAPAIAPRSGDAMEPRTLPSRSVERVGAAPSSS